MNVLQNFAMVNNGQESSVLCLFVHNGHDFELFWGAFRARRLSSFLQLPVCPASEPHHYFQNLRYYLGCKQRNKTI